jgi:BirA family biotin operon repressor/biotin-[acetyl-CoA-carboxylase] ligase
MDDFDRPALDVAALAAALGAPWRVVEVVEETESTNADLSTGRTEGPADDGRVLAAEFQRAGRGRLDRSWGSPPRAGLTFSARVRPPVAPARWGWLPLLTGVAVADAVRAQTGVPVGLKWPNDLLTPAGGKLAGILVQAAGGAAVIGVGLNVSSTRAELPVPTATSLAIEGARSLDRTALLSAILAELGSRYLGWVAADGDAQGCGLADDYRAQCQTIGQAVRISGAGDTAVAGMATGIDSEGRLRLEVDGIERVVAAGDIVHLRRAERGVD